MPSFRNKNGKRKSIVASAMKSLSNSFTSNSKKEENNKEGIRSINIMLLIIGGDDGKSHELMPITLKVENQKIGDLIKEVQEKATVRSLRNQGYHCVCNGDATVLNSEGSIENYFPGDVDEELYHLAIPVPYGKSAKDIIKMAKPILADENFSKKISKSTDRQISINSNEDTLSQVSEISDNSYHLNRNNRYFDDSSSSSSSSGI